MDMGDAHLGPGIWRSPASPRRWVATSHTLAMPVAAIGMTLGLEPSGDVDRRRPSRRSRPVEEVDGPSDLAHSKLSSCTSSAVAKQSWS